MATLIAALIIAIIELVFLWGKVVVNRNTVEREGENYRVPLLTSGPLWVRWFHKAWFVFHLPAQAVFVPILITIFSLRRGRKLVIPFELMHALNFTILVSTFAYLSP